MEKKTLSPRKIINSFGKLHYSESNQAWGNIILKKEIVDEFPQLKEKRSSFSYEVKFCRDSEEFEKMVKILKKGQVMPLLMFIYQEEKN